MFRWSLQSADTRAGKKRSLDNHPRAGNDGDTDRWIRIRRAHPARGAFGVATSFCRRSAALLFANRGIPEKPLRGIQKGLWRAIVGTHARLSAHRFALCRAGEVALSLYFPSSRD